MFCYVCGHTHTPNGTTVQVRYGVDAASAAVSSFNANTADYPGAPFNPPGGGSAQGMHCTVCDVDLAHTKYSQAQTTAGCMAGAHTHTCAGTV